MFAGNVLRVVSCDSKAIERTHFPFTGDGNSPDAHNWSSVGHGILVLKASHRPRFMRVSGWPIQCPLLFDLHLWKERHISPSGELDR